MLPFIQIALTIAAIVAICAGLPQLRKLLTTKNSDEFSLKTWFIWVGTQSISVMYAIAISDPLLIAINSVWVLFYSYMVILIIRYSPRNRAKLAPAQANREVVLTDKQPIV